ATAGQLQPAPAHQAGRPLSALRRSPAHRRPATPVSARVGTLVAEHRPQGNRRRLPGPPGQARYAGCQTDPLDTCLLPPADTRPVAREASTSTRDGLVACLSRVR